MRPIITCPECGKALCPDLRIHTKEVIVKGVSTHRVEDIDVIDSCSAQDLARDALHLLSNHVYNGISTFELCKILREKFGVLEQYCCDIVQLLKIELDMYCPDRQHLYYV